MTEQDLAKPNFNPGGVPDTPDERDFQWSDVGAASPPFDWSVGYDVRKVLRRKLGLPTFNLPVKNQGETSCGGQAFSQLSAVLEAVATDTHEERSAKYVYSHTAIRDVTGTFQGSRLRDNAEHVRSIGVSREIFCPSYENGQPGSDLFMTRRTDITEAAHADAKLGRAKSYAYVNSDIDSYAQAIRDNAGLVTLIGGQNNGTWFTPYPKPPIYRQWGHFMYWGEARLINGKRYIGGIQSWGPSCGDQGWQWFGEDYFASGFVEAAVTMVFDDSVIVPPKYIFTRDLYLGISGVDVRFLQVWLNTHGFKVALAGPGSPGQETSYFGKMTRDAVARFQFAKGIKPAYGYFGPITRQSVNSTP